MFYRLPVGKRVVACTAVGDAFLLISQGINRCVQVQFGVAAAVKNQFVARRAPTGGSVGCWVVGCPFRVRAIFVRQRIDFPISHTVRGKGDSPFSQIAPPIGPAVVGVTVSEVFRAGGARFDGVDVEIAVSVAGEGQGLAVRRPGRVQVLGAVGGDSYQSIARNVQHVNLGVAVAVGHEGNPAAIRRKRRRPVVGRVVSEAGNLL